MSGKDEGLGLFRRMARKVAAPARELVGLTPPRDAEASRPTEFDKAEMKAMIERKRRNDYVRKRELDTLRRIRREGLTGEQAQALTMQSSRMDEPESRSTTTSTQGSGIKAKIDAIERQMVGGASAGTGTTTPGRLAPPPLPPGPPPPILTTTLFDTDAQDGAPTIPVPLSGVGDHETGARLDGGPVSIGPAAAPRRAPVDIHAPTQPMTSFLMTQPLEEPFPPAAAPLPPLEFTPISVPDAPRPAAPQNTIDLGHGERVEVSAAIHDEALDEPVIAFAGGDFQGCERSLQSLIGPRGERRDHDETWLVLFDLYRAIGQQTKFEALTMEYVDRFHQSAPQWFSLPKMLAEATANEQSHDRTAGSIGWVCPAMLDSDAVNKLDALSMQLPLPWVLDWTALTSVDVEGAGRLQKLFASWASQALTMHWIASDRLMSVLHELSPTGVRDADPVYWMLRLEALRLMHRPDQFDEVAIDYCVTFEVSPPSWENARSKAHLIGATHNTRTLSLSVVGEAVTSFLDTSAGGDEESVSGPLQVTSLDLSGQLSGDLSELLGTLTAQIGPSHVVRLSCALLMRVDFVAAGDLLNWVTARRAEGREIVFQDAHRLVALMFGAMGINEAARVQLRHN